MKPVIDAAERKRRKKSTLNRVINNVKACLNRAFQNGHVSSDAAWRRLKKFKGADGARTQWLTVDQCRRLINAAAPDFRPLVHAAMLTGARWGELRALKCRDYDPVSGTINIAASKSGKPRRVYLTDDGKAAFESWTAGRGESEVIFNDRFGNPWGSHDQHRIMSWPGSQPRSGAGMRFIARHPVKRVLWLTTMSHLAQGDFTESVFVLAEKPPLQILTQVRNGLPAAMFEQVASTLGLSASTLAAKLGIARRTVTRKRGNGAPLSTEISEKLLRAARVRNLGRALFTTDEAVSEWLSKPDASLSNIAPLDLLDTDLGAREVENLLRALAYGHFV